MIDCCRRSLHVGVPDVVEERIGYVEVFAVDADLVRIALQRCDRTQFGCPGQFGHDSESWPLAPGSLYRQHEDALVGNGDDPVQAEDRPAAAYRRRAGGEDGLNDLIG
jgi:hypothetical protein